ncbi:hypothetical protein ABFS82_13G054400 [Erythranthe guttata]
MEDYVPTITMYMNVYQRAHEFSKTGQGIPDKHTTLTRQSPKAMPLVTWVGHRVLGWNSPFGIHCCLIRRPVINRCSSQIDPQVAILAGPNAAQAFGETRGVVSMGVAASDGECRCGKS